MSITTLPPHSELEEALRNLEEAGLAYSIVCQGPEPVCPHWSMADAA
ncbi:MAG: hypothetical protein ACLFWM_01850 [Actinomycetota bacterium]